MKTSGIVFTLFHSIAIAGAFQLPQSPESQQSQSRRNFFSKALAGMTAQLVLPQQPALAKEDCYKDCYKNCKTILPNDKSNYCQDNCIDYCAQPDRTDGLSGSVSSASGEVGILGGTFGTGTVVKGEDKPPSFSLPGLNFDNAQGRQLLKGNSKPRLPLASN